MMSKEAMKLALEALGQCASHNCELERKAITALREALAKPDFWEGYVPEPVKPAQIAGFDVVLDESMPPNTMKFVQPAQQQEPVAWVYPEGLEALKAGKPWTAYGTRQEPNNTALYLSPQPDIEPYAWVTFTPYGDEDDVWYENPEGQLIEGWTYKPLYDTTPPQRTWVGLTDEDIEIAFDDTQEGGGFDDFARAIEAKLRSKNEDRN